MKNILLLYLGTLLSLGAIAQISSPLQNFNSAGGATGTPHASTSVPTHFSSIGQPMVIPRLSPANSAGGIMVVSNVMFVSGTTVWPAITGFTSASGEIGATVTITGTNFSTTPASNTVRFNGTGATVTASTATSITTTVPTGATTGKITVTVGSLTATSATDFTVIAAGTPVITSFAPFNGPVGTTITITGTNFSAIAADNAVKFNGTVAVVTTSTATSITTNVPAGATTGKITVVGGGLTGTSSTDFQVTAAATPTITSFTPTSGAVGTTVTITGTNFSTIPADNTVKFNGTAAIVTASTATSITTSVPAGSTTGPVTVAVGGLTGTGLNFTVIACTPPVKPVVTASALDTESPVLTSSSNEGNQWFVNGNVISGATNKTYTVTALGIYSVQVTVSASCVSTMSENFVIIITGDSENNMTDRLTVYPNPVAEKVIFETPEKGIKTIRLIDNTGRVVEQVQFGGSRTEVDARPFQPGVYYFIVTMESGTASGKLLKN